jgi:hypothetical protein
VHLSAHVLGEEGVTVSNLDAQCFLRNAWMMLCTVKMHKVKSSVLVLLQFFVEIKSSSFYNLSCVVGLCERFNIRNIDLVDFSHGINSGLQYLPGKNKPSFIEQIDSICF